MRNSVRVSALSMGRNEILSARDRDRLSLSDMPVFRTMAVKCGRRMLADLNEAAGAAADRPFLDASR